MAAKKTGLAESTLFLAAVTFIGGYINAYSSLTRGGFFTNGMTANMSKLGIALAHGQFASALDAFTPIIFAVLGAVLSEMVRVSAPKDKDWRCPALLIQTAMMAVVAFLPLSVPDVAVTRILCMIVGYQLCLFRKSKWGAHNTTICTGNFRSVGQYLFSAMHDHDQESGERAVKYTLLVFSFLLGSFVSCLITDRTGTFGLLFACAVNLVLFVLLKNDSEEVRIVAGMELTSK